MGEAMLRSELLDAIPHGFFGQQRPDGSPGELNARDADSRALAAHYVLPDTPLALVDQVHSAQTVTVDQPLHESLGEPLPQADAIVTATPGILLGIVTADCAPVLLADGEAGVIGAAHAGWRGAHGGVLDSCVAAMIAAGARRESIAAAIGPCIAQESYEVDEAFRENFDETDEAFFAPAKLGPSGKSAKSGHLQFDLPHYVAARLRRAGVFVIDVIEADTYALNKSYFSFRRATHNGESDDGRQISIIGLPAP